MEFLRHFKQLFFKPDSPLDTINVLKTLDKLHFAGELTEENREWLKKALKKTPLLFGAIYRRYYLDEPPTPDRFWWFDEIAGETLEEQIADNLKDPEAYLEYRKRLAGNNWK